MLKLTYFPGTIAVAAVIALEETGLDHELVKVDFADAEQTKPAYHRINPKGRVPALITDDGILTETGAILDYLLAVAPDSVPVPADPLQLGRMREAMFYIASTMHVNHAHKMRGHRWADHEGSWSDMTAKVPETMTASAQYVEDHILQGPFICGDQFTLADAYLYAVCVWLRGDDVDLAPFPKIRRFIQTMEARASVRSAIERGIVVR